MKQVEELVANPDKLGIHFTSGIGIFRYMGPGACVCLIKAGLSSICFPEFNKRIRNDPLIHSYSTLVNKWFDCKSDDERRELLEPYVEVYNEFNALMANRSAVPECTEHTPS